MITDSLKKKKKIIIKIIFLKNFNKFKKIFIYKKKIM